MYISPLRTQEALITKNRELSHSVIHLTNIAEGEVGIPDRLPDLVAVSPVGGGGENENEISSSHSIAAAVGAASLFSGN